MPYWIYRNGQTIGPLTEVEVRAISEPDTLVGHGQDWLQFGEHPDFLVSSTVAEDSVSDRTSESDRPPVQVPFEERIDRALDAAHAWIVKQIQFLAQQSTPPHSNNSDGHREEEAGEPRNGTTEVESKSDSDTASPHGAHSPNTRPKIISSSAARRTSKVSHLVTGKRDQSTIERLLMLVFVGVLISPAAIMLVLGVDGIKDLQYVKSERNRSKAPSKADRTCRQLDDMLETLLQSNAETQARSAYFARGPKASHQVGTNLWGGPIWLHVDGYSLGLSTADPSGHLYGASCEYLGDDRWMFVRARDVERKVSRVFFLNSKTGEVSELNSLR